MKDIMRTRVAVVSGGANGLCRLQAEALLMSGAVVCILGKNKRFTMEIVLELQNKYGAENVVACSEVDARVYMQVEEAFERIAYRFGRIDLVVSGPTSNFLRDFNHISSCGWERVVQIDSEATINLAVASSKFLDQTSGRFLYLSPSVHGFEVEFSVADHRSPSVAHMESYLNKILRLGVEVFHQRESWEGIVYRTVSPNVGREFASQITRAVMGASHGAIRGPLYRVKGKGVAPWVNSPAESRL